MDKFEEKLFNDLSNRIEVPIRCEYVIKNALNIERTPSRGSIRNIFLIIVRAIIAVFMTTGVVWASVKMYENVWKQPEKVEQFYGENSEIDENAIYGTWHSKEINISKTNVISEKQAIDRASEILNKFGYESENITSIELVDNASDNGIFYRATTDNKFLVDIDAKNPQNFKLFTDAAYKDIANFRGTREDIEKTAKSICEKYGFDLSKYNYTKITFNETRQEDANIWTVQYNKEYNGVVNTSEEIQIGIIPEVNELEHFIYTDVAPENTEILINKENAEKIVLEKERELNIGHVIENIETELDIKYMNGYAYFREKDFQKYYEQTHTAQYPIEKLEYYRVEEKRRQIWKVTLKFEIDKNSKYQESSFTYFVDTTTGEIVGGE